MKKKEFEFLYDSSKIWFDSYNYHSGQKEGTYFLELRSDSDDFVVYDVFNDISYEIISYLSKGHVVLYGPDYRKTKHERRKRFGRGWEEAEYSTDCIASRLKQELMDSRWSDGFFADVDSFHEYKAFWSMTRVYSKYLYILQETLDFSLLQKTNTCREHPGEGDGIDIKIFPEATLTCLETAEKTVQFYNDRPDSCIFIGTEKGVPEMHFDINYRYFTLEQFVETIRPIIEKHNKKLEARI